MEIEYNGTFSGECRYCGKYKTVLADTQESADDIVTSGCKCGGRQRQEQKTEAYGIINNMFGELAKEQKFEALKDNAIAAIATAAYAVIDGEIIKVKLTLSDGSGELYLDSDGSLKISRKRAEELQAYINRR